MSRFSRFTKAVAFFFFSLAALAAMVFAYIFFSGGGEVGERYLSPYYSLAVLALTLSAALTKGLSRREH